MTDRELLELAGKAADIPPRVIGAEGGSYNCDERGWHRQWNPLEDDGDALRLASKLNMTVEFGNNLVLTPVEIGGEGTDPLVATRRAIVRAAAVIGEAMP